jgi:hypothetical protein
MININGTDIDIAIINILEACLSFWYIVTIGDGD